MTTEARRSQPLLLRLAIVRLRNALATLRDLDPDYGTDRAIYHATEALSWLELAPEPVEAVWERLGLAHQAILDEIEAARHVDECEKEQAEFDARIDRERELARVNEAHKDFHEVPDLRTRFKCFHLNAPHARMDNCSPECVEADSFWTTTLDGSPFCVEGPVEVRFDINPGTIEERIAKLDEMVERAESKCVQCWGERSEGEDLLCQRCRSVDDSWLLAERDRQLEDSGGEPAVIKTGFDRMREEKMRDPKWAARYRRGRARLDQTERDRLPFGADLTMLGDSPDDGHPHKPVGGKPGDSVWQQLWQSLSWTDRFGTERNISEMTSEHLLGVAGYIRWYAKRLWKLDYQHVEGNPDVSAWLIELPLWMAIERELYARDPEPTTEDLLAFLRSQGLVPWEIKAEVAA